MNKNNAFRLYQVHQLARHSTFFPPSTADSYLVISTNPSQYLVEITTCLFPFSNAVTMRKNVHMWKRERIAKKKLCYWWCLKADEMGPSTKCVWKCVCSILCRSSHSCSLYLFKLALTNSEIYWAPNLARSLKIFSKLIFNQFYIYSSKPDLTRTCRLLIPLQIDLDF
jgi:hypothetical protein